MLSSEQIKLNGWQRHHKAWGIVESLYCLLGKKILFTVYHFIWPLIVGIDTGLMTDRNICNFSLKQTPNTCCHNWYPALNTHKTSFVFENYQKLIRGTDCSLKTSNYATIALKGDHHLLFITFLLKICSLTVSFPMHINQTNMTGVHPCLSLKPHYTALWRIIQSFPICTSWWTWYCFISKSCSSYPPPGL